MQRTPFPQANICKRGYNSIQNCAIVASVDLSYNDGTLGTELHKQSGRRDIPEKHRATGTLPQTAFMGVYQAGWKSLGDGIGYLRGKSGTSQGGTPPPASSQTTTTTTHTFSEDRPRSAASAPRYTPLPPTPARQGRPYSDAIIGAVNKMSDCT